VADLETRRQPSLVVRLGDGPLWQDHLTLSEDLPLVSVAVDTRPRIEAVLGDVMALGRGGLVTLERARLLSGEIVEVELPEELHDATKPTIYLGRQERVLGTPAFMAVCELLYRWRDRLPRGRRDGTWGAGAGPPVQARRGVDRATARAVDHR
jgi:hypothetical protein